MEIEHEEFVKDSEDLERQYESTIKSLETNLISQGQQLQNQKEELLDMKERNMENVKEIQSLQHDLNIALQEKKALQLQLIKLEQENEMLSRKEREISSELDRQSSTIEREMEDHAVLITEFNELKEVHQETTYRLQEEIKGIFISNHRSVLLLTTYI